MTWVQFADNRMQISHVLKSFVSEKKPKFIEQFKVQVLERSFVQQKSLFKPFLKQKPWILWKKLVSKANIAKTVSTMSEWNHKIARNYQPTSHKSHKKALTPFPFVIHVYINNIVKNHRWGFTNLLCVDKSCRAESIERKRWESDYLYASFLTWRSINCRFLCCCLRNSTVNSECSLFWILYLITWPSCLPRIHSARRRLHTF